MTAIELMNLHDLRKDQKVSRLHDHIFSRIMGIPDYNIRSLNLSYLESIWTYCDDKPRLRKTIKNLRDQNQ